MIDIAMIKEKIVEAIKNSGMTQTTLASKIGVTQSCIAHYLKDDILPALDTFANLCSVLDLDANDILCIDKY